MGCYSSLLEEHMAVVQRRLMQVTRPSKAVGCRSLDAAHMAVAVAVAMAVCLHAVLSCPERSFSCCLSSKTTDDAIHHLPLSRGRA